MTTTMTTIKDKYRQQLRDTKKGWIGEQAEENTLLLHNIMAKRVYSDSSPDSSCARFRPCLLFRLRCRRDGSAVELVADAILLTNGSFWPWLPSAMERAVVSAALVRHRCGVRLRIIFGVPGTPGKRLAEYTMNGSVNVCASTGETSQCTL